jgi:hypothetical protein
MRHNEFHNLHASANVIRVIKLRRVRWVGHVARMGKIRNAYKIFTGKPEGRRPIENIRIN